MDLEIINDYVYDFYLKSRILYCKSIVYLCNLYFDFRRKEKVVTIQSTCSYEEKGLIKITTDNKTKIKTVSFDNMSFKISKNDYLYNVVERLDIDSLKYYLGDRYESTYKARKGIMDLKKKRKYY